MSVKYTLKKRVLLHKNQVEAFREIIEIALKNTLGVYETTNQIEGKKSQKSGKSLC